MKLKFTNLNRTAPSATVSQAVNSPKIATKSLNVQLSFEILRLPRIEKGASEIEFLFGYWPDTGAKPPITSVPLG